MQIDPEAFTLGMTVASQIKAESPSDTVACKIMQTYGLLAAMIKAAGCGNHLEIGVWYGASAIVAAKTKQEYGLGGRVVGLDDFCGYDKERKFNERHYEKVKKYLVKYGVEKRVEIIPGNTFNFPTEKFADRRFVSAFIDGNHWGEWPYSDFMKIEHIVDRYVMFDDHDEWHPAVQEAVEKIISSKHADWRSVYSGHRAHILERISNG